MLAGKTLRSDRGGSCLFYSLWRFALIAKLADGKNGRAVRGHARTNHMCVLRPDH